MHGVQEDSDLNKLLESLKEVGLPADKEVGDIARINKSSVLIRELDSETCADIKKKAESRNSSLPGKERLILKPNRATPPTPVKSPPEDTEKIDDNTEIEEFGRETKRDASLSPSSLNATTKKKGKAGNKTVLESYGTVNLSTRSGRGGRGGASQSSGSIPP